MLVGICCVVRLRSWLQLRRENVVRDGGIHWTLDGWLECPLLQPSIEVEVS